MKKIIVLVFVAILLVSFSSCDKESKKYEEINLNSKQKSFVSSGNDFSFNLLKEISSVEEDINFMVSPISINYALAMTANGAEGNTQDEMLTTLGFEQSEIEDFNEYFKFILEELTTLDSKVEFSIANSIWYKNGFNVQQSFLDVNQEYYNAEIQSIDFSSSTAKDEINNWVANATHDKIETIIDDISGDAVMYLINAIYFLGEWKYEFDQSETQEREFYLSDNSTIQVSSMRVETDLKYFNAGGVKVVELPYGKGNFVMDIILPEYEQSTDELIQNLSNETWVEWTNGFYETAVNLTMPKFTFEYEKGLIEILQSLGISDLFNSGAADLSGINGSGGLFVSKVKHKTFIDVDEEGTEAAAVTSVEVSYTSVDPNAPIFVNINRPFVFLIREASTGVILFSGVVENPME